MLTSISSTVCSQNILTDSICFSKEQAKTIIKDLKRLDLCDSITVIHTMQLTGYKKMIEGYNKEITIYKDHTQNLENEIKKVNLHLKAVKTVGKIGIPGAIAVGFLIGTQLK